MWRGVRTALLWRVGALRRPLVLPPAACGRAPAPHPTQAWLGPMSGGSVAPDLSKALADKMLQGWTMLADLCPVPNCHVSGPARRIPHP
eukprot:COSAG04_NODE_25402_length_308_cov_0.732057_1_plen_88_part_10